MSYSVAHALWMPFGGLIKAMANPGGTWLPFGIAGWVIVASLLAGLAICVVRGNYAPMIVLAGIVPPDLANVFATWPNAEHLRRLLFAMASLAAMALSLAVIAFGFARARGNRIAAALMLPADLYFLFVMFVAGLFAGITVIGG